MGDSTTASDDVGGSAYDAALAEFESRDFGTEDEDLKAYAKVGGAAAGAAACAAVGAPELSPICASIGGKAAEVIYDGIQYITHSGPTPADLERQALDRVDAIIEAARASLTTSVGKTYGAIRDLAASLGQTATDAQISTWLSDVAHRLRLQYVWPEVYQCEPGPGGTAWPTSSTLPFCTPDMSTRADGTTPKGWRAVLHPFRLPPISRASTFGTRNPTAAEALPIIQVELDRTVEDLRRATLGVLALLSAGAIRVESGVVKMPLLTRARINFQPPAEATTRQVHLPVTQPRIAIGGIVGAGLGAAVGAVAAPKHRKIGALVGALVGGLAGGVAGSFAGGMAAP